jgi:hypothetical protein
MKADMDIGGAASSWEVFTSAWEPAEGAAAAAAAAEPPFFSTSSSSSFK